MNASVVIAVVAALANFLQGWDNATMAGVMIHIKTEFRWEDKPTMQGLATASPLIGATLITLCSGGISAWMGRRPILMLSSAFYFVSGLLMLWSPNVFLLLFARLLDGFGIGLAITFVPMYISEMAPPEVRGLLSTLPQLTYTTGFFLAYSFVFFMSLINSSSWRLMLGLLLAPSFILFVLMLFYLPESPRWLLSKGRMLEAKQALQILRGKDDVSSEMALLVEGLEVGGQTTIEQYVIGPSSELVDEEDQHPGKEEIKLLDSEGLSSMVGLRVSEESFVGPASRHASIVQNTFSVDPVVALMENVQEKLSESGSKGSMVLPNFGSMFSESYRPKNEESDESESERDDDYESGAASESDDNLQSPLISRQTTSMGNTGQPISQKSMSKMNQDESVLPSSVSIGSGWQLAWKWKGEDGPDGMKRGNFKRLYLHEAGGTSGLWGGDSVDGEFTKAAALVSQSAFLSTKQVMDKHGSVEGVVVHPSSAAVGGPRLSDLLEPGVKHALFVGMGIEMLQQLLGINAVLLYTPQILEQAGVQVLLANLGISSESTSLLISAIMNMLMLPCVVIAMRLMDVSGRRSLLLSTNPVLTASLITLVLASILDVGKTVKAIVCTVSVISYGCFFSMGFGPIPSILCSEIFPTKVRGICIPICALTYWVFNILVTYTLPILLSSIGLPGVFSIFALASLFSWAFVFFKVPETKGMPIEVIVEFFSVGANAMQNTN
ncbi:hypothetical protein ACS0TY_023002 [Phlomoides rotata]